MPSIRITDEAMCAIRSAVEPGHGFLQTGTQNGDHWDVPIDEDALARLEACRLSGETLSDVIIRAIAMTNKNWRN